MIQDPLTHERQPLVPETAPASENDETEPTLEQRAAELRTLLESRNVPISELGAEMGKTLVRRLVFLHIQSDLSPSRIVEEVQSMVRFYNKFFEGSTREQFHQGFFGEFAVAYALQEQLGYPVYYSTTEEDMEGKVDFLVDLDDGQPLVAVQIKSVYLRGDMDCVVYKPGVDLDSLPNELEVHISDRVHSTSEQLTAYCEEHSFRPMVIVIPSPDSDIPLYNLQTGLPVERGVGGKDKTELANRIWQGLDEKGFVTWD